MKSPTAIPVWKAAPFLRLLPPLISGILLQWYVNIPILIISVFIVNGLLLFLLLSVGIKIMYNARLSFGILLNLLLIATGALLTWNKDMRHTPDWYGHEYTDSSSSLLVRIAEPPTEKTKSYKTEAFVEAIIKDKKITPAIGKLLIYFAKDSNVAKLHYGDRILVSKKLQPVKNNGNPGAFNYSRYAAFQQLYHNVFLNDKDWVPAGTNQINIFRQFIFSSQKRIITSLKENIKGSKNEYGVAEALLIGYKEDLDKDLVQAYSNTGVVHIIAISGLHLGLIYIMLRWLLGKIPVIKKSKLTKALLILACLWLFSLLTGASASVLRSAVMFTCIIAGENFVRKGNIYNSLAASAFIMLCFNPYYLWDVGFQLSYLAVIGIVLFQRPVYNLIFIKNKWLDKIWKLVAVSLAAQLLTFPICIYYFHQFPNLFLLANIIAVPLSSVILFAEIGLIAFGWLPGVGAFIGKATNWMVYSMNNLVLYINNLSFSLWDKIPATLTTTFFLYAVVISVSAWLLAKKKAYLYISLLAALIFAGLHTHIEWQVQHQQKIIIYNVPQKTAVDFVKGSSYVFRGDSIMLEDGLLQNFHIKPSRVALQLHERKDSLPGLQQSKNYVQFGDKKIVFINKSVLYEIPVAKIDVDIILISNNPRLYIPQLAQVFNCKRYVFDASNPLWKIEKWKQDCDELNLRYHSVPDQGAFILNL